MLALKNSRTRFGLIAIIFHWVMATLIIGLLTLGLYMQDLPKGMYKLRLYGWHKEYGLLVLALAIVRISWRFINITPELNLPRWERMAARIVHLSFYVFMFAMPISGWMMSSASNLPVSFFGLFVMPTIISENASARILFLNLHEYLAYALIGVTCLHILAALKHQFINKDDILKRMIS